MSKVVILLVRPHRLLHIPNVYYLYGQLTSLLINPFYRIAYIFLLG